MQIIDTCLEFWDEEVEWRTNMPRHSNPADFGLTYEEAHAMRSRYLVPRLLDFSASFHRVARAAERTDPLFYFFEGISSSLQEEAKRMRKKTPPREKLDLQSIKERTNIADIAEACGVQLRKCGRSYVGRCPFHDDKSPSFTIYDEGRRWHCFSEGIGGDAIDFVMRIEGIPFLEACKKLGGT